MELRGVGHPKPFDRATGSSRKTFRVKVARRLVAVLLLLQLCASVDVAAVTFQLTFADVVNDTIGNALVEVYRLR